jgi:protein pelota
MKIIKRYDTGTIKLRVETMEDLWSVQRILFPGDVASAETERRFRASESDKKGELKRVFITLKVERSELDKSAQRLRIIGKIADGKPLEYVQLGSHHTLNIAQGDVLEITKESWPGYVSQVLKSAVTDSKRPRLGLIVADDEKALPAYLLGYGVEFRNEIYSRLSKRMSQKDFTEQQGKYYAAILEMAKSMEVDTVVIAGPGFTKDDVKAYGDEKGMIQKMGKRLVFASTSNAERSGIYELIRGAGVAKLLEIERIRTEFILMERFLSGLANGLSKYGVENVKEALGTGMVEVVMVNDSVIGEDKIREVLLDAEAHGARIEVFNSDDEAGQQLGAFKGIACIL